MGKGYDWRESKAIKVRKREVGGEDPVPERSFSYLFVHILVKREVTVTYHVTVINKYLAAALLCHFFVIFYDLIPLPPT